MAAIFDLCKYGGKNTASACVLILNALSDHQLLSCQKAYYGGGGGVGAMSPANIYTYTDHMLHVCAGRLSHSSHVYLILLYFIYFL